MTVSFKNIPAGIRVPVFYAEIDPSKANTAGPNQRTLIIGQITASGVATPNVPLISSGVADAKVQGGLGSMLAQMTVAYRQNDPFGEVWYLPLADDAAAVAAIGSINTTTAATAAGTLALYIGGIRTLLALTGSQTAAQTATALAAALNANTDLAVTAAVDGTTASKVNLTAKNKGLAGNDIDIRFNYLGAAGGESFPTSYAATIVPMASGATNPVLTTALANLVDMPFDFIVLPYTDTTSLDALKAFLNDTAGRWSWATQVYGHVFTAYRGTFASQVTFGTGRNDQHASCLGIYDSPTPVWKAAAIIAGIAAVSVRADPGTPIREVTMQDFKAPPLASRFTLSMRNTLLFDGISTFNVQPDGSCILEKLITTYQLNSFGQPDNSYLDAEMMFQLMYVLRALASVVTTKYARVKLAADGTRFGSGANIVTPSVIKADIIAQYQQLEIDGHVQQSKAFAAGLIVQQNSGNPNRIDVLWDGILIDRLDVFALLAQFRNS